MTAEQWRRTRDLFERALDESPADVEGWLAREAADDAAVRAEVGSLLLHHSRAGEFLSQPIGGRLAEVLADDEPRFAAGQAIGPYVVVREIGRGGMGRVYQATDSRLARTVAIKALAPEFVRSPEQRERLRREARAAAALAHPGICTIYALEEIDGELLIVSELVDGHSLREEIARGMRPSAADLLVTARALAEALAIAHLRGVTHRDLKPENVMRAHDGTLKILDFGLAVLDPAAFDPAAAGSLTRTGIVVGTPAYMAPEQLNGMAVDPRTDVFSYGVLLYEYATGTHPYDAPTGLARIARVLESQATPIEQVRPDLAGTMAAVIGKSLRKAPADRYASATEIVRALAHSHAAITNNGVAAWWRTHQAAAIALYFLACALAWQIKEWQHGPSDVLFLFVGVAATTAAVFRGHLLFTEQMNRGSFAAERRRAEPATLVIDAAIGLALTADGLMLTRMRPLVGVLTIGLGVCIVLARAVVERATAAAAFGTAT